jgi:hypothetical protein
MTTSEKLPRKLIFATEGTPSEPSPLLMNLLEFFAEKFGPDFVSNAIDAVHNDKGNLIVTWSGFCPALDGPKALVPLREAFEACWDGSVKHRVREGVLHDPR